MPRISKSQEWYQKIIDDNKKLVNTRQDNIRLTKKGKLDKRQTFKTITQKNASVDKTQAQQCIVAYKLDKLRTTNIQKLNETKIQKARKITHDFN